MGKHLSFQYCQKIVLFNIGHTAVLLARRKGEADYDGVYSFIGGKLETTDGSFVDGLRREKNEEIGEDAKVRIYPSLSYNAYYVKKDGSHMILPHYYAEFEGGEITLNDEYSDYEWVDLEKLSSFEPKIETVEPMVQKMTNLRPVLDQEGFVQI